MKPNNKLRKNWRKLLKCKRTRSATQGKKKKAFPCKDCTKIFTKGCDLNRHVEVVHRQICHACPTCGKKFRRLFNAKVHATSCTVSANNNTVVAITPLAGAIKAGLISVPTNSDAPKLKKAATAPGTEKTVTTPHMRNTGAVGDVRRSYRIQNTLYSLDSRPQTQTQESGHRDISYDLNTDWDLETTSSEKIIPKLPSAIPPYPEERAWLKWTCDLSNTDNNSDLLQITKDLEIHTHK